MAIVPLEKPQRHITLGISACLMGHKVRYNGQHKRSSFCMNTLADYFNFIPVCPEVGIGLGTPREPIRLVGTSEEYRVVGTDNPDRDVTDQLEAYGREKARELDGISGYILMQKSPSCGMERVKIYGENGIPSGDNGPGVFARALMAENPLLPVEEEGRLHDPILRENFFTRVFALHRWQTEVMPNPSHKAVADFYTVYKYQIMAHNPQNYAELGQLIAKGKTVPMDELMETFSHIFMTTLAKRATRKSHTNVMLHLMGYLKKTVAGTEREEILKLIEQYRQGVLPLVVPMTLLRNYLQRNGGDYIQQQVYLQPHPEVLGLRNTI